MTQRCWLSYWQHRLWSFVNSTFVYMLTEYIAGGELFHHLRLNGQFMESDARMYAAEVLLVIEFLHSKSIIHRDIKPENILIDEKGHIKLTDFEFAKVQTDR